MGILVVSLAILILFDQIIKYIVIKNIVVGQQISFLFLRFSYVENYSIYFGKSLNILFAIISIIILCVFVNFFFKKYAKNVRSKLNFLPFMLIIGGGCSNIMDRFARGFVVDYIEMPSILDNIVFNLADVYISIGIVLLIVFNLIKITDEKFKTMDEVKTDNEKVWKKIWKKVKQK